MTEEVAEQKWQMAVQRIAANDLDGADQLLLAALELMPQSAKFHHDLGVVRGKQRRPFHAVASFRRSLELSPRSAGTWGNLGLAYLEQDQIEEAISHLQRALALGPNAPETFNNLGVAYMRNSQPQLAAEKYQQALRLCPDYAEAHLNLARALLIQGDYAQGWLEYEWRWRCPGYKLRDDDRPRWGGEPLGNRTVLLYAEQGLGDTLQFVRYASIVQRFGGRVVLECQPQLVKLLAGVPGIDQVIPAGANVPAGANLPPGTSLPHYDVQAPLMSLPGLLATNMESVPDRVPYLLFIDESLIAQWCETLAQIAGFRVGIAW